MTYFNNAAAVYFEQGKFAESLKACEDALETGYANRADYKLLGNSLSSLLFFMVSPDVHPIKKITNALGAGECGLGGCQRWNQGRAVTRNVYSFLYLLGIFFKHCLFSG